MPLPEAFRGGAKSKMLQEPERPVRRSPSPPPPPSLQSLERIGSEALFSKPRMAMKAEVPRYAGAQASATLSILPSPQECHWPNLTSLKAALGGRKNIHLPCRVVVKTLHAKRPLSMIIVVGVSQHSLCLFCVGLKINKTPPPPHQQSYPGRNFGRSFSPGKLGLAAALQPRVKSTFSLFFSTLKVLFVERRFRAR